MILEHELTLPAETDRVFALLNDVERIVSCVPGAELEGRQGEDHLAIMKVKVGPVSASYHGRVRFVEVDSTGGIIRVHGSGQDRLGNGDVEADVQVLVTSVGTGTRIAIRTDLVIRGRIAQLGKSAIPAVSNRILARFADNLGALLRADAAADSMPASAPTGGSEARDRQRPTPAPVQRRVDVDPTGPGRYPRWTPVAVAFGLGVLEGWLISRAFGPRQEPRAGGGR